MDPDTKRLMLFAAAVGGVLLALIAASFLTGHRSGKTPVVLADSSPIRIKPENPGGMKVDAAESDVFSGGLDSRNARLGPAAEAPNTKALHGPAEPAVAPKAEAQAIPPLPPAAPPAPPAPPEGTSVTASLVRPVLPPLSSAKPDVRSAAADAGGADKTDVHSTTPIRVAVQLAAMPTEAGAKEEWQRLSHRLPELFNGHTPAITRTERDGRAMWRLRTTGFPDSAKARVFCEQVRAKGGNCAVADF